MKVPLSVCLLARDEADHLAACVAAVAPVADEIVVVVDARSRDATEEVARRMATRVEVRDYAGDRDQKAFAVGLAKHDWVLLLDPDERVPPALADAVRDAVAGAAAGEGPDAYRINRITRHLGRWIRHGDFYPDWTLRLFRRSRARWAGRDPHSRVEIDGDVGRLTPDLEHHSYRDLSDQIQRIDFFSGEAARALDEEGARASVSALALRPPARFFRAYVLKQGFRDGAPGFVIAAATAFHVFLKYAKLWERQRRGAR